MLQCYGHHTYTGVTNWTPGWHMQQCMQRKAEVGVLGVEWYIEGHMQALLPAPGPDLVLGFSAKRSLTASNGSQPYLAVDQAEKEDLYRPVITLTACHSSDSLLGHCTMT